MGVGAGGRGGKVCSLLRKKTFSLYNFNGHLAEKENFSFNILNGFKKFAFAIKLEFNLHMWRSSSLDSLQTQCLRQQCSPRGGRCRPGAGGGERASCSKLFFWSTGPRWRAFCDEARILLGRCAISSCSWYLHFLALSAPTCVLVWQFAMGQVKVKNLMMIHIWRARCVCHKRGYNCLD